MVRCIFRQLVLWIRMSDMKKKEFGFQEKISNPRDKVNFRHPKLSNQALHIAGK